MKEYIKKFETAASANDYEIVDIPFTTTVATNPAQNLVCNAEDKKLVNTAGIVTVEDSVLLINFILEAPTLTGEASITLKAEPDMTWGEWIYEPKYNTVNLEVVESVYVGGARKLVLPGAGLVTINDVIMPNRLYTEES